MKIKVETLYRLIVDYYDLEPEDKQFSVIDEELLSAGYYKLILQDKNTSKYYAVYYTDLNIINTYYNEETKTCDGTIKLRNNLIEVFPKQVVTTIYVEN